MYAKEASLSRPGLEEARIDKTWRILGSEQRQYILCIFVTFYFSALAACAFEPNLLSLSVCGYLGMYVCVYVCVDRCA